MYELTLEQVQQVVGGIVLPDWAGPTKPGGDDPDLENPPQD